MQHQMISHAVFLLSLLGTLAAATWGHATARRRQEDDLAGRSLSRWLVGLSGGATANSGFVVTGAVGLGYSFGTQWILLPLAWLLGDLIFWRYFPHRINAFGHRSGAITLSEILRYGLRGRWAAAASILAALVLVVGLSGYISAQWVAGRKFMAGSFGLEPQTGLLLFGLFIVAYSGLGGFRGSVYADTYQAIIRIAGVFLILGTAAWMAITDPEFARNIAAAGPNFLRLYPGATIASAFGFVAGWASAAIGFGLGQPQIVSRYLAAKDPQETRATRWIYIGFVQFTWISMSLFGLMLRGIMPGLADPEMGLSVFVQSRLVALVAGVVVADIFASIASTANSLLIALGQSLKQDILVPLLPRLRDRLPLGWVTLFAGLGTMLLSLATGRSVLSLAMASVSVVGAGIAVPVMIKVMSWRHSAQSLTLAVLVGVAAAVCWAQLGLSQHINEAAVGMALSAATNWLTLAFMRQGQAAATTGVS